MLEPSLNRSWALCPKCKVRLDLSTPISTLWSVLNPLHTITVFNSTTNNNVLLFKVQQKREQGQSLEPAQLSPDHSTVLIPPSFRIGRCEYCSVSKSVRAIACAGAKETPAENQSLRRRRKRGWGASSIDASGLSASSLAPP